MGWITLPKMSLQAQLVAVRRAASRAALDCRSDGEKLRSYRTKAQAQCDALVSAALTLDAVRASREALDMMPDAHRDQLAIRLAALGYRAVRGEEPREFPSSLNPAGETIPFDQGNARRATLTTGDQPVGVAPTASAEAVRG